MNATRESAILRSRIGEIITSNEPRTGMSIDENVWRNWSSQSMKSTRRTGAQAFKRRSGLSVTVFKLGAGMKILPEAKLPVYQKSSMAHRATWYLRLLRQLKCLTALKTSSKSLNYTDMTLVTCWVAWHWTGRIYTGLCITKKTFHGVRLRKKLWKYSKRTPKED